MFFKDSTKIYAGIKEMSSFRQTNILTESQYGLRKKRTTNIVITGNRQ